jgi:hypothetical protein
MSILKNKNQVNYIKRRNCVKDDFLISRLSIDKTSFDRKYSTEKD